MKSFIGGLITGGACVLNSKGIISTEKSLSLALNIQSYGIDELTTILKQDNYSKSRPTSKEEEDVLQAIFSRVAQIDPLKGIELLGNLKGKAKRLANEALFKEWTKSSPDEALNYALNKKELQDKKLFLGTILNQLSKDDPARAYKIAEENNINRYNLTLDWANHDPLAALKALKGSKDGRGYTGSSVYTVWMRNDPEKALAHFRSLENLGDQKVAIAGIIEGFDEDFEQALEFTKTIENKSAKKVALYNTYSAMSQKDPQKVAQLFLKDQDIDLGGYPIDKITENLVEAGEEIAKDFVSQLDPKHRSKAGNAYISSIARKDVIKALGTAFTDDLIGSLSTNSQYYLGINAGQQEPEKALDILDSQTESRSKGRIVNYLFDSWVSNEPEAALQKLQEYSGKEYNNTYSSAGRRLANNPDLAVEWIDTIENSENKTSATRSLVSNWLRDDQDAAGEWVNSLPDGNQRDSAVSSIIYNYRDSQPDYALEWAYSISNQSTRNNQMRSTYLSWRRNNPEAARRWLETTDLITDSQRESW